VPVTVASGRFPRLHSIPGQRIQIFMVGTSPIYRILLIEGNPPRSRRQAVVGRKRG